MASPAFRNASSATGTASAVNEKPADVAQNDILILDVYWEDNATLTVTPPSGFVEIAGCAANNTSPNPDLHIRKYWKRAGASEPSTYTTTVTGADSICCHLSAYSGAWTGGTPIEDADSTTSAQNLTLPSVDAITIETLIVAWAASWEWSNTFSSSALTERFEVDAGAVYTTAQAGIGASGTKLVSQNAAGAAAGNIIVLASTGTTLASSLVPPNTINKRNAHLFVR